jgi:gluconolactonase
MSKFETRTLLSVLLALVLIGCGGEPAPEPEVETEPSAGTVLKLDAALDAIVPADYKIEKLSGGFMFTEGPLWQTDGGPHLLFSDVRGNAIYKWDATSNAISDFRKPVFEGEYEEGRFVGSNGLTHDPEGRLVICEHGNRRVLRIEKDNSETVIADKYDGKRLNSPNDIVYKSDGSAYFTDPPYGLAGQDSDPAKELPFNGIFRLSPDGEVELLNDQQTRPNGIAFSPDEKTLYVANSDPEHKVWMAYRVKDDGTIDAGRVFADVTGETDEGLPDGLKLDKQGNLYLTGPGGVWIYAPDGTHLGTIQPEEVPANVGWGDDGHTLYMTARTGLYRITLTAEGTIP